MRRFVPLVLLAVLVAGCSGPAAVGPEPSPLPEGVRSEARFELLPGESVFYESSADKARLHLRLFRPDAPEGWRAPVILVMSPYFGPDSREGHDETDPTSWDAAAPPAYWRYKWLVDHFVPRGYAVAFADVRGTGESGGCLEQTGTLQTQDGFDTVEFLGTQAWSNGRVGMYGKSYDGETQQATATLAPPHLATIVPVSSVAGQYDYSYYDGVPYTLQTFFSNFGYAYGDGLQPGSTRESAASYPERAGCNADHFKQGLDESGDWNAYWEEREFRNRADKVRASVLYVHGLQDWNVKPNNVRDWFERLDVPKLALLGQWEHDYPEENRWKEEWSRQDWQDLVWRWFDHWLLGVQNDVPSLLGQVQVQDTEGRWRVEPAFPPPATPRAFHLAGEALAEAPGAGEPRAYAEPPLPGTVANLLLPEPTRLEPPRLAYETAPLAAPLHWSGWPTLALEATLDKADAHFAVHLLDVEPGGEAAWVARGYLSAVHREGVASPKPVPAGEPVTYEIRFFPGDVVVPQGHSLRLVLMPYDDWTSGAGSGATVTVHGGTLTLPLVEPRPEAFLDVPLGKPIREPVT